MNYNKLLNIVNDAIIDNEEAVDALDQLLSQVKDRAYNEGYADAKAEYGADEEVDEDIEPIEDEVL